MASKQQQRKQQRIVVQRVEALEQLIEELPVKVVQLIRGHGIHSSIFDVRSSFDIFEDDTAKRAALKIGEAHPPRPMESRNTPEKKHNKQNWCLRIVEIRAECDVAVDSLTLHRLNDPCRNQNWRTIERAAKTVVIDDDSKQDLPLVGLIFVYAARLRMKVLELAQDAQLDHSSIERDKAALYNTRAASLLTLLREIRTAHGKKFKANPNW